jgi:hypothetical protein
MAAPPMEVSSSRRNSTKTARRPSGKPEKVGGPSLEKVGGPSLASLARQKKWMTPRSGAALVLCPARCGWPEVDGPSLVALVGGPSLVLVGASMEVGIPEWRKHPRMGQTRRAAGAERLSEGLGGGISPPVCWIRDGQSV